MIEIKEMFGEFGTDLETFSADDRGFVLQLELEIGFIAENGSDLFKCTVCDQAGFKNYLLRDSEEFNSLGITSLQCFNLIIVKKYDLQIIKSYLNSILIECSEARSDWSSIAKALNKHFYWEYQNEEN